MPQGQRDSCRTHATQECDSLLRSPTPIVCLAQHSLTAGFLLCPAPLSLSTHSLTQSWSSILTIQISSSLMGVYSRLPWALLIGKDAGVNTMYEERPMVSLGRLGSQLDKRVGIWNQLLSNISIYFLTTRSDTEQCRYFFQEFCTLDFYSTYHLIIFLHILSLRQHACVFLSLSFCIRNYVSRAVKR